MLKINPIEHFNLIKRQIKRLNTLHDEVLNIDPKYFIIDFTEKPSIQKVKSESFKTKYLEDIINYMNFFSDYLKEIEDSLTKSITLMDNKSDKNFEIPEEIEEGFNIIENFITESFNLIKDLKKTEI